MAEEFEGVHDGNVDAVISDIDARGYGRGLVRRDYSKHPSGYHAAAPTFPDELLIPQSEWQSRLDAQKADKSSLWDLREAYYEFLKSLDQDGKGLCWAFSSTKAAMNVRTLMGLIGPILSAWWVAGKVKGWRDEGGWGAESLTYIAGSGVPSMDLVPGYRSSYDGPAVQADAALHKVVDWFDGTDSRDKNKHIMITGFLLNWPMALDYNNLSHSMAGCYLESINPLVVYTDNSWGDISQYGPKGTMKLTGNNAIPDGIVVARTALPGPK